MFRTRFRTRARFIPALSGGGGAWNPAQLGASLALWLDADDASTITLNGSTVSQWDDKSGNENHVAQATASAQPLYTISSINGKPVVQWTTGYHGLFTSTQFSFQDFDVFVAYRNISGSDQFERLVDHSYDDGFWLGRDSIVANSWRSGVRQSTPPYGIAIPLTDGIWHIIETQRSGTTHNLVGDGGAVSNTQTVVSTATQTNAIGIGAQFFLTAQNLINGEIGEVLILSKALSTNDRQRLEGYLAWKWGLEENLPIDHPYRFDGSLFGYGLAPNAADYGTGATTAYSLRYVSNSYSGPVVRVREDAGNTEQDFTPVQITDGTLEAFVGVGNNGFVATWYDQSGNGKNATQTTAVSQPKIVNAGALITENGKPAIVFDGVNDSLITNGYIVELSQNSASVFSAGKFSGSYDLVESDVSTPYSSNFILSGPSGGTEILWVNATSFGIKDAVNQSSMGFIYNGVNFQAYLNGATSGAAGPATVNPEVGNRTVIGASADFATNFSTSTLQEIIIYRSDESANRSAIELNINQHYGIY